MSYPTSIDSFTTKATGDTIQPSHVNNLQTAVVAIETKLKIDGAGTPVVVAPSNGDYTDIQTALDAVGSNGGTIFIADGTYTIATGLLIKKARTRIICSGGAVIQCNGNNVATLIKPNASSLAGIYITGGKWLQTSVTVAGVAFDFSDTPNADISPSRIEEFATAIKLTDTANVTFYNEFHNIQIFNCNNGIEISGTLTNNNTFTAIRIRPKAGGAGKAVAITDSRGNLFLGCDFEPATDTGITGVHLISSSSTLRARENTFIGCWFEQNETNLLIDADCVHNTFVGCTFASTSNSRITDNSTSQDNIFIGCNPNSGSVAFNWLGTLTDRNRNELLKWTETASAVNELTVANAAAGSNPTISATGGDTDIGITLTSKGTGGVVFSGALRMKGFTTVAGVPTTTEYPTAKDFGIHKNSSSGVVSLVYNDGGVIKTVALA